MKRLVCLVCGCWLFVSAMAQTSSLCITTDKTTSLVFPFSIRHVDRGTKDILVQQVKEADNILLVKASAKNFSETNLSVVTDDGSIYIFIINYDENPVTSIYNLPENKKASISAYANGILDNPKTIKGIKDKKWDIHAGVTGIYIKEHVIYYQVKLDNKSPVDYDIDLLRFYITDKKKGKRTAVQENELKPLYLAGNDNQVKAFQQNVVVVALDKFIIPDAKFLAIEVMEKCGGRNLFLKINNRKIMQAITLPDLK
jgi:conjugative transposon TraN protein